MDDLRRIWPEMHERHAAEPLKCAICGKPATCVGIYDNTSGMQFDEPEMARPEPACGECCGHCCEDGRCEPLASDNDATGVRS